MNRTLLVTLLLMAVNVLYGESLGQWITDWHDLHEIRHSVVYMEIRGTVQDGGVDYSLRIRLRHSRSDQIKHNLPGPIYGLNRRSESAVNTQIISMQLSIGGNTMDVPAAALRDVLNPLVGERMSTVFYGDKQNTAAVIIDGPDGAESYMVAFIFRNGRFHRRQIRPSQASSPTDWKLLEDKVY